MVKMMVETRGEGTLKLTDPGREERPDLDEVLLSELAVCE